MTINSFETKADEFAFDGCHKFYLINSPNDKAEALDLGYDVYPIEELPNMFKDSCPLRFINNWDLSSIVPQFEPKVKFSWNGGSLTLVEPKEEE